MVEKIIRYEDCQYVKIYHGIPVCSIDVTPCEKVEPQNCKKISKETEE